MKNKLFAATGLALGLMWIAGCSVPTTRYYSLAQAAPGPVAASPASSASSAAASASPLFIELAPVSVPERFARPQLVVRAKDSADGAEVRVLEQRRWASSFENELRDALASGIASRLGAVDLTAGGRQRGQPVLRIAVRMSQFDAVLDSRIDAAFSWTVRRSDDDASGSCRIALTEAIGGNADSVAQGAQRITARLADAVAASAAALQAGKPVACPAA